MCEKLLFTLCFTVHKPKITVHGQLTVTQALIFKKKKKNWRKRGIAKNVDAGRGSKLHLSLMETFSITQISNFCLTPNHFKLVIGCKVLHYKLLKENATWSQNSKAKKTQ